jgi:CPA1 family monovalent cation:H+ antiporter
MVAFVLNGVVFLLIGLQFTDIIGMVAPYGHFFLFKLAATVCLTTVLLRFVWVYALTHGTRLMFPGLRKRDPVPPWQNVFIVAWAGMRGVVSLATALALPLMTSAGDAFPHRDLIVFLSFTVILFTLIVQGTSLPWLLRKLAVVHDWKFLHEDWHARKQAAEHALEKLAALHTGGAQSAAFERIHAHYREKLEALGGGPNTPLSTKEAPSAFNHPLIESERKIWQQVLEAEKHAIVKLRREFAIGDDVMHDLMHDIDLMHMRFR